MLVLPRPQAVAGDGQPQLGLLAPDGLPDALDHLPPPLRQHGGGAGRLACLQLLQQGEELPVEAGQLLQVVAALDEQVVVPQGGEDAAGGPFQKGQVLQDPVPGKVRIHGQLQPGTHLFQNKLQIEDVVRVVYPSRHYRYA